VKKTFLKLTKLLWIIIAILIIVSAVLFGALRAATPFLEKYQHDIVEKINQISPYEITIDDLSISWYHFSPVIAVDDIKVLQKNNEKRPLVSIDNAYIGVDLIKLVKNRQVVPNKIIASNVQVNLPASLLAKLKAHQGSDKIDLQQFKSYLKQLAGIDQLILKDVAVELDTSTKTPSFVYGDLLINRSGTSYNVQGSVSATTNPASIDFMVSVKPNLANISDSAFKAYLEISNLNLKDFKDRTQLDLPGAGVIEQGKLWIKYSNQQVDYLAIETHLNNLTFDLKQVKTKKAIPYVSINAIYRNIKGELQLAVNHLAFAPKQTGSAGLIILHEKDAQQSIDINAQDVAIDTTKILSYLTVKDIQYQKALQQLSPKITLDKTRDNIVLVDHNVKEYHISMALSHVSTKPYEQLPGLQNVNLVVNATQQSGQAAISFENSVVTMPWLFRAPIQVNSGAGLFSWKKINDRWILSATHTHLTLPQGEITPSMKLFIGGEIPTRLELMADANITSLTQKQVYGYLPVAIIPEPVTAWLDSSLLQIGKSHAQLILRGDITQFPFDNQEGIFSITAQLNNSTLHFYDKWPNVTKAAANLTFKNRSMIADISAGESVGLTMNNAHAEIPYMGSDQPVNLTMKVNGHGAIAAGIQYFQVSPLGENMDELKNIKSQGQFDLALNLDIPIANQQQTEVLARGRAVIHDVKLQYGTNSLALNKLNGTINFINEDISSDKITGFLGDKAITLSVAPVKKDKKTIATQVNLTTNFSVADLNHYASNIIPSYISGASIFTASMIFDNIKGATIALQSNMKGVAIDLPAPLGKTAADVSSFNLIFHEVNKNIKQVIIKFQNTLDANIFLTQQKNNKFKINKGTVTIGDISSTMPDSGIDFSAKLSNVDVNPWIDWYKKNLNNTSDAGIELNSAQVSIDNFTLLGQALHNLTLTYRPYSSQYLLSIMSDEIAGNINVPKNINAQNPINASFDKLYLQTSALTSTNDTSKNFTLTPYYNVDFICKNCHINKINLGSVKATIRTYNNQLSIPSLNLSNANYNFSGSASWSASKNSTSISGKLYSGNTSKMLADFSLPANIASSDANLNLSLSWPGAPYAFTLSSLNGTALLDVKEGSINDLNKNASTLIGLGNILTALNLESLPGRITQGISTEGKGTGTGFYFKQMYGDFSITNGNLWAKSAYLDGTVAYISMNGRIGLSTKDYDLQMKVIPHLTSSLPVIATIAGGPIIGAATWIVNKAVSPAVNKIAQYNYIITGSWSNPQVKNIRSP